VTVLVGIDTLEKFVNQDHRARHEGSRPLELPQFAPTDTRFSHGSAATASTPTGVVAVGGIARRFS
jgi:hypothetical protein